MENIKIVIFAGHQPHHKHLCGYIAQRHDVVGVIHPEISKPALTGRKTGLRSIAHTYGWLYAFLRLGAKFPTALSGWSVSAENRRGERDYFPRAGQGYAQIGDEKIFSNVDVNSKTGRDVVESLEPDVVINLGGVIYGNDLIQSCKLFLNYHSGISPIYNGAGTVNFAFANGHPHLCGGTLMTMSPVIDGGVVLAHYFPSILEEDTLASLNMKTYAGAAVLYDRFLSNLKEGKAFSGAPQHRPMFYVRGNHWTLYQTLMTRYYLRSGVTKRHRREETIIEYWKQPNNKGAKQLLNESLSDLLWGQS